MKWLRLERKRAGPVGVELDLVLECDRTGEDVGLWLRDLVEQLRAGDRLMVALNHQDVPADSDGSEVSRCPTKG